MSEVSEVTTEKLIADFKVLVDDAEQLIGATASQAGERVAALRQRLLRRVEEAKDAMAQCEKELRERGERAKSRVITCLQDENWSRLAIAAGLGVLVGLALRCRRSKSYETEP
jgi:ElaB/YqjD/DUF883 family membrane-anchored ribosome-binding protein